MRKWLVWEGDKNFWTVGQEMNSSSSSSEMKQQKQKKRDWFEFFIPTPPQYSPICDFFFFFTISGSPFWVSSLPSFSLLFLWSSCIFSWFGTSGLIVILAHLLHKEAPPVRLHKETPLSSLAPPTCLQVEAEKPHENPTPPLLIVWTGSKRIKDCSFLSKHTHTHIFKTLLLECVYMCVQYKEPVMRQAGNFDKLFILYTLR